MSDPSTREAALDLRALAADQTLDALQQIRTDRSVADRAHAAGERVLADPAAGPLLAELSAVQWLPDLLDLAARLLWSRQHAATRTVVGIVRAIGEHAGPHQTADHSPHQPVTNAPSWQGICSGYSALTDLNQLGLPASGLTPPELRQVAAGLLTAADAHLDQGDTTRSALVASAGLWVLFHQELHDADPASPLIADPQGWLDALRESRVGQILTTGLRQASPPGGEGPARATRTAPLVLTGAYPRFAAPVVEALQADQRLRVASLELSAVDKAFKRMAVEPWVVELRLRAGLGEPIHYAPLEEQLAGADTVLADWADAGAVLASLLTPPGTALTVRVHSVDALRCWLHLIDWSAVGQLICVGPHVLDLLVEQLGGRLAQTRQRVLPNIVHLGRFDHPRGPGTDHTMAMVGWARAVKDPLWTVELLERLRRRDDRWRLLLIGHGFARELPPGGAAYAQRFARRLKDPGVQGAIEFVPFTSDLPPILARAGWVVSSSMRESWGVGPMEAVAAGAVPIIRDWPFFARWGGPRRLYPEHWVVGSLEEAQERMEHLAATGRRAAEAEASRALLATLIDPDRAGADYRAALTAL